MLDPSNGLILFTDGSCWTKDRIGGWGWIAVDADDNERTSSGGASDATIGQMELAAIADGLETLLEEYGPCSILLYSDSEYAVLGATHRKRIRKVNRDEWNRIDAAVDSHDVVEFIHVKGHHESYYNHIADKLAGQARKELQDA